MAGNLYFNHLINFIIIFDVPVYFKSILYRNNIKWEGNTYCPMKGENAILVCKKHILLWWKLYKVWEKLLFHFVFHGVNQGLMWHVSMLPKMFGLHYCAACWSKCWQIQARNGSKSVKGRLPSWKTWILLWHYATFTYFLYLLAYNLHLFSSDISQCHFQLDCALGKATYGRWNFQELWYHLIRYPSADTSWNICKADVRQKLASKTFFEGGYPGKTH